MRGMSKHPCGATVLRTSEEEVHHLGVNYQEVQDPVAQGGVQTQGLELDDKLGGSHCVEC
jgi:hypothetical protein